MRALPCLALLLPAWLGTAAPAQETEKRKEPPPEQRRGGEPIDETETAADRLRRLLRLKPGPARELPQQEQKQGEQQKETQREPQQDPDRQPPTPPTPPPVSEPDRAAQVLRRALGAREPTQGIADAAAFPIHGSLSLTSRGRWSDRDHDTDLRAVVDLDFGDATRNAVTGRLLGRTSFDLDGDRDIGRLRGIEETRNSGIDARLYEAWIDVHGAGPLRMLRLGRQTIAETPVVAWFDGARAETERSDGLGLWAGAFGGVPTRLFESTADADWIAGAAAGARPWQRTDVRVDWMHVTEQRDGARFDNDLLGASVSQAIGENTRMQGRYNWLEGDSLDWSLRAWSTITEWGLQAQASYYELLSTQRALATEFDPYFTAAFARFPYRQLGASVSKDLGEHFSVATGGDLRWLSAASDEGEFNRDYERVWLGPTVQRIGGEDLSLSLIGELWNTGGEDFATLGADVRARPCDAFTVSLGSAYSLWKFDSFTGRERAHVRTWHARFDYRLERALRLDVRYALEDDDLDRFHTATVAMTWTF
jgi:hypothetical protein